MLKEIAESYLVRLLSPCHDVSRGLRTECTAWVQHLNVGAEALTTVLLLLPPNTSLAMAARTPTVALVSLLLALTFASSAGADPLHVPLTRRSRSHPAQDLHEQANRLLLKYGLPARPVKSSNSSVRVGRRASSSSVAVTNHVNFIHTLINTDSLLLCTYRIQIMTTSQVWILAHRRCSFFFIVWDSKTRMYKTVIHVNSSNFLPLSQTAIQCCFLLT